jgi:hypothetical protein
MWHAWERREKCTRFQWESPKERGHLEDRGVDETMGLELVLGILAGGFVEWIQLAKDRYRRLAVVNMVMNLWVLAQRNC